MFTRIVQFLGYCVDLMNEVFPWMHIVRGRARKPSTQGSIEVSHKAFKAALVKWLDQKQFDNWIGKPHTASYLALLGPSFKMAKTEYGLQLAKRILMQIKKCILTWLFLKKCSALN